MVAPIRDAVVNRVQLTATGGGAGIGGISAGTNLATSGTVNFSNSNGVTFGMNPAGVITASVVPGSGAAFSGGASNLGNTSGDTGTVSNQLIFAGGNNITLSQATNAGGATLTISGAAIPAQTNQTEGLYLVGNFVGQSASSTFDARTLSMRFAGLVSGGWSNSSFYVSAPSVAQLNGSLSGNFSASGGSSTFQTLNFANSNGFTFSNSNGSVIGSYTVPTQSNQTLGGYVSGNTTGQSSSSTFDARSLSVSAGGIVSAGWTNGSLAISATTAAQTNQTGAIYNGGNTTGASSSSTYDARSLSINAAGIISAGWTNGSLALSATVAAQTNQSLGLYAVSNTTGQSSSSTFDARSLSFQGAGVASVGMSGGSVIISVPSGGGAGDGVNIVSMLTSTSGGGTAGATFSTISGSIGFMAGSNITLSQTSNTINIIGPNAPAQTAQTVGLYGVGNTTQNSSTTLDARTLSFNGLGGVTVGFSNGSVQISGAQTVAQTNQTGGVYALGNTTGQSSSSTHDERTLSINAAGIISAGWSNGSLLVSATTAAQTTQPVAFSASGGSSLFSTLNFANSNGLTFSNSNGSVVGSYTVPTVTNSSMTVSDAGTSGTLARLAFTNLNGVTLSLSTGAGGSHTIVGSHNALTSQSNQSIGLYGLGNTTQNSSTTLDARTLSFNGLGGATVGFSNGSIQISAPSFTESYYAVSNTTQGTSMTADVRSLSFNGAGIASVGMSNGSIIVSVPPGGATGALSVGMSNLGNTLGTSGTVSNQLVFVGGDNVTLSQSVDGQSATVTISAAAGGGGGMASRYIYPMNIITSINSIVNGSMSIRHYPIYENLTATRMDIFASFGSSSNANTSTFGIQYTLWGGIYTMNGATLSSLSTGSGASFYSWASNNNNTSVVAAQLKLLSAAMNISATPGDYYLMAALSTRMFGSGAATTTVASLSNSCTVFGGNLLGNVNNFAELTAGSATSQNYLSAMGLYSVTTNAVPPTISVSGINATGVNVGRADFLAQFRG